MISLVTAPPGGGKSFYAVRAAANALVEGRMVAGNVELRSDWVEFMCRKRPELLLRRRARAKWLDTAAHRFHYAEDLEELFSIRLEGTGEGRGLMILDEAHNWMNARSWSAGDRKAIVRFFSQHRKLGWDVLLIAQNAEMIDKQVRTLFEYHVHLRNLRRARFWGVPISPINLFLAIHTWHAATRVVVKREVFPLSWRKDLYESMATFAGLEGEQADERTGIILPSPPGSRRPDGRTAGAPAPAARPPARPAAESSKDAVAGTLDQIDPAELDPTTPGPDWRPTER